MSPAWKRPPLPEETFSASFGEGEGELLTLTYPKPLPMRLDRWLVSQRSEQSRARIQKFIDAGYVRVNGKTGKAKTPLRQGDEVQLWMPPPEPLPYLKPEPMELNVLFEDAHLIVINKPAGLTVHPAPGNKDGTLVNGLLHHCPDLPGISGKLRPGIVHRLDKDTTGCIVIAKSQEALVRLQRQIQKRIASREYLAVVHGVPAGDSGTADTAIDEQAPTEVETVQSACGIQHDLDVADVQRALIAAGCVCVPDREVGCDDPRFAERQRAQLGL